VILATDYDLCDLLGMLMRKREFSLRDIPEMELQER
jgi:hypothetical protein